MSTGAYDGERKRELDGRADTELRAESGTSLVMEDDASFEALLREVASPSLPAAPPQPQPGEVIASKYRIEEKLGQGGMGVVFRATHLISEKQVAIKWMLRSAANEQARTRFVRESRAAARIDHPNVVDVYDIGQDADRGLYMVMQLLRGESLGRRIARGPIGVVEAVDLLLPAMRGVAAVHECGIVHRDLKPDNIFLCESRQGERREAKVLDFGISAVSARAGGDVTLTRDGTILGTPAYMSPEQIQDSRTVDARADVYAFGVILYEMLTGKLPFRGENHHSLVLAIMTHETPDPSLLRADLPRALSKIVLRALDKNREQRFESVAALVEALGPHGSVRDSSASALVGSLAAPRPGSKRPLPWIIAAALALLLWGAYAVMRETTQSRDTPRAAAEGRPSASPAAGVKLGASPAPSVQAPAALPPESAHAVDVQARTPLVAEPAPTAPAVTPRKSPAPHGPALRSGSTPKAAVPSAAAPAAQAAPTKGPARARSGKIAIEDL